MGTVLLHIGHGKTGSSALQVALAKNRAALAAHGIDYPPGEDDDTAVHDGVTSGNGTGLARFLVPSIARNVRFPQHNLRPVLERIGHSEHRTMLYSSELLAELTAPRLGLLQERVAELGWDLGVVLYVRNVAGHALSTYSQHVKRAGEIRTFDEFLREGVYRPAYRSSVRRILEIVPRDRVTVIHYDSVRTHIWQHFCERVLRMPVEPDHDLVERQINRSLTSEEVRLLRLINAAHHSRGLSRKVSDVVISRPPFGDARPHVSPSQLAFLEERFGNEVRWMNRFGIEGGSLAVRSAEVAVTEEAETEVVTPSERFLTELLGAYALKREQELTHVVRQARESEPQHSAG